MKPAAFDFVIPDTVDEALSVLADQRDGARIIAGGQSLTPMLNMRLASPSTLVDISKLSSLKSITVVKDMIRVGAAVTQEALLNWTDLETTQPLLSQMLPWVGHYQTRQRGTVCGSLAHSDPSAELPLALAALDGEVIIQGSQGKRSVKAREFQTGMMATALQPDEMIIACAFPVIPKDTQTCFREVSHRHGDFALVAIVAIGKPDGVRLGIGGVSETPKVMDLPWLEEVALETALNELAWQLRAADDHHASARYRRRLVRLLGKQIIDEMSHAHT